MVLLNDGFIRLTYEANPNLLLVKWADTLSVESVRFFQTIVTLFHTIQENKITNLVIDSGKPTGGVLTEEVIHYLIQSFPKTSLKNIALLESPDYLWDNNLYQVLQLLISTHHLPMAVKMVKNQVAAKEWFCPTPENKIFRKKAY